jgi:hypothetical protein
MMKHLFVSLLLLSIVANGLVADASGTAPLVAETSLPSAGGEPGGTLLASPSPGPSATPTAAASPSPTPQPTIPPGPWGQNLVVNGDFEIGFTGWTLVSGEATVVTSANGVLPYAGQRMLYGGSSVVQGDFVVRQDIDLLAAGFTGPGLDAGAWMEASVWLQNGNAVAAWDDQVLLRISCLDASSSVLARMETMICGVDAWTNRATRGFLPVGTRTLRIDIVGLYRTPTDNNSYVDDVFLMVVQGQPQDPTIIKDPMVNFYGLDAVSIVWETDTNEARPLLEWGPTAQLGNTVSNILTKELAVGTFIHVGIISGLSPSTTYYYRVSNGGTQSAVYSFLSLPPPGGSGNIAVVGDSRDGASTFGQICSHISAYSPSLVINVGDVVPNSLTYSYWDRDYWTPMSTNDLGQTVPSLIAFGNHEGEHPLNYAMTYYPGNGEAAPGNGAWQAFTFGSAYIITADSNTSLSIPDQTAWLEQHLSSGEAQACAFRIVLFHHPPYSNLWYCGTDWIRNEWVPLFQTYGVDLVISGHTHDYERGLMGGRTYMISGGGGSPLENPDDWACDWGFTTVTAQWHFVLLEITPDQITVSARDHLAGQPIETFILYDNPTPTPTITPSPTVTPSPSPSPTPTTTATPAPSPTATPCPGTLGDLDDDGDIDSGDALLVFQIALGIITPTPAQACRADADLDGTVTTSDALCVFQEALGEPNDCF